MTARTEQPAGAAAGRPPAAALSLVDVVVAYAGRPVLRGVSLDVRAGEVVALMGANGSGKSTLVRAALGLAPLAEGTARLFGVPVGAGPDWRRIGYVPQRLGAGTGVPATVREVVASGRLARRGFLRPARAADRAAVTAAIEAVGLADRARDKVTTLSGGQQQRVLIARAMVGQPDLLILDEPVAGVDQASQLAFVATLRALVAGGTTIVLVLHEIGPLADLLERTVVLDGGRIGYDGPPVESQAEPHLHDPHPHGGRGGSGHHVVGWPGR